VRSLRLPPAPWYNICHYRTTLDSSPILQSMHWMLSWPKRPHEITIIDSSGQSMLPCLIKVSKYYRNRHHFPCVEAHDAFLIRISFSSG
jgi:hypothetical protein